jgi:uncharacterized membrane protein YhaH (DUF805 family)
MIKFELREAATEFWANWIAWAILAVAFAASGVVNVFLALSAHQWWPVVVAGLAFVAAATGAWMVVVTRRSP